MKSFQAAAIAEKYHIDKYLRANPKATLQEAVQNVTYRNIVMCPGHLVEKWKKEIETEIPLARATIVNDFKQILKLKEEKGKKPKGKDFYIISKDFCKLSFQKKPTPYKVKRRRVKQAFCDTCGKEHTLYEYKTKRVCSDNDCNGKLEIRDHGYYATGLVCPDCGEILFPCNTKKLKLDPYEYDEKHTPLMPIDFTNQKANNSFCSNCGVELWAPHLDNINETQEFRGMAEKNASPWLRITHYRNKAKKGYKTVWVHKKYLNNYLAANEIKEGEYSFVKNSGVRKFAPSVFIKNYLGKGFFDIAIFDEAHMYKGLSAQGHAFHSLIKASKKQLALTGTIANGVASSLFYLLYRLDPKKLIKRGYKFTDELQFAYDYGVVEEVIQFDSEDEAFNSSSRGKKIGSPKVKPGINPLVFPHFLLDKTVFLDLSDLAAYLPKLYEDVVLVDMPSDLGNIYFNLQNKFKRLLRDKGGKKLMATMLQTLLAYPDKPYGMDDIRHPDTGQEIITIPDLNKDKLYPKEEKLIELVNKELNEGRRVFVYTEFTGEGDKNVTGRIKRILEEHCNLKGKVAILKSSSPQASKRERWLKEQAYKGKKVIISNPRCVETGLDFIMEYKGRKFNYPTLIFYQLGYNLFTLWQSSRRHYRLNQTEECRTYYMGYRGTLQSAVINIMAEKKVATAAIQGQFSAEGLAAMAQGVDARVQLAKALRDSDTRDSSKIEEMFSRINEAANNIELSEDDKKFLEMLENKKKEIKEPSFEETFDFNADKSEAISLFDFMNSKKKEKKVTTKTERVDTKKSKENNMDSLFNGFSFKVVTKEDLKKAKRLNRKAFEGQLSLF